MGLLSGVLLLLMAMYGGGAMWHLFGCLFVVIEMSRADGMWHFASLAGELWHVLPEARKHPIRHDMTGASKQACKQAEMRQRSRQASNHDVGDI